MLTSIRGVRHTVVPGDALDYHAAAFKIVNWHPLGDVYVAGPYGYVPNGPGWLRFVYAKA